MKPDWSGVFPAVTTQFREDLSLDVDATARVIEGLIRDGVSGLIVCGTVGENCSLAKDEKIAVMEAAKAVARGRVPVISGIAEFTSAFAIDMAKEAARIGLDGVMVMPALVYSSKPHETAAHFRSVAKATDLPVMVYNNPPIYKNDVTPEILASLADCETIVCFKESSGDTRRFIDLRNMVGDRFVLFAGLDDVVVESIMVGAVGWVSGPVECVPARRRDAVPARQRRPLRRGDEPLPVVHAAAASRRPPRPRPVHQAVRAHHGTRHASHASAAACHSTPKETAEIEAMMKHALATRPALPDVGLRRAA